MINIMFLGKKEPYLKKREVEIKMKNILVSITFEVENKILIEKAVEIAEKFYAKIWIVHIAAPEPEFVGYDVGPQYIRDDRAKELRKEHKLIQQYAEELKARNIESESLLIQGATVEMILEETQKLNIDLLIIGHHEHGLLYEAFVGSTAPGVVKKSKVPVLIVPL